MATELSSADDSLALRKLFNCLLDSVSEGGNWRDFDESWSPIITAITAELLLNAGVKLNDKWYIYREQYKPVTLGKSIQFLNTQIREDGSFGTDLWDTLKLGKLISGHELKSHFSNYDKLHSFIVKSLDADDIHASNSEWRGSGFYACGIDYFDLVNLVEQSDKILEKLVSHQQPDGCWSGAKNKEGHPLVSPVWHTSQAIVTLNRKDPIKYNVEIEKGIKWIVEKQESDGSWPALRQFEIYFTSYAILALSNFNYDSEIAKAVNYLKSKIDNTGKCSDLGGTLMCAIAFWELSKGKINQSMTFMEYLLASNVSEVTNLLESQIQILSNDSKAKDTIINDYKETYHNADIVLTKKQTFLLGLFLAFASFGGINGIIQIIQIYKEPKAKIETVASPPATIRDTVFVPSDTVFIVKGTPTTMTHSKDSSKSK